MRKSVFCCLLLLALSLAVKAQGGVSVQFYTPSTVRIVKGGPAPEHSFAVRSEPQAVTVKTSAIIQLVLPRDLLHGPLLLAQRQALAERRPVGAGEA